MIKNTSQDWTIGSWVKVGFIQLQVVNILAVKDGLPDIYELKNNKGKKYRFIPHRGLEVA
jgi:hypothetical protein